MTLTWVSETQSIKSTIQNKMLYRIWCILFLLFLIIKCSLTGNNVCYDWSVQVHYSAIKQNCACCYCVMMHVACILSLSARNFLSFTFYCSLCIVELGTCEFVRKLEKYEKYSASLALLLVVRS